jgi:aminoglycoside phosphotransferase (APT) family kinase protein
VRQPGDLLAAARDSDIFAYGSGLVLRRSRAGRSMALEAPIMAHAAAHGYPVPEVDHISDDGTDLVMERLSGPTMLAVLSRRPWTIRHHGRLLAQLHQRLHRIPAPDWVPSAPAGVGDALSHLDLHPLNVILTAKGPVVIDWPNARRGHGNSDVALTWALLAAGAVPAGRVMAAVLGRCRKALIESMLGPFDRAAVAAQLAGIVQWKVSDAHLSGAEQQAMLALARQGGEVT